MKFSQNRLLLVAAALSPAPSPHLSALAYLNPSTPTFHHHRRHCRHHPLDHRNSRRYTPTSSSTRLNYKEPSYAGRGDNSDFSSNDDAPASSGESGSFNVWSVLANTERWISDTLDKSNQAEHARRRDAEEQQQQQMKKNESKLHFADEKVAPSSSSSASASPRRDNPYARKEISYVCETGKDLVSVVGGVFRRVREARELGESHGRGVEARLGECFAIHFFPPVFIRFSIHP